MALLALFGAVLIGAGAVLDWSWLMVVGVVPLALAPIGLLVPALRISAARPVRHGYKDMNYFGAGLTVLGFSPTEQDQAAKQAEQREQAPGGD